MNVNRAKNLTIIFFIVLNIVLLSINYANQGKYQLSEKQRRLIYSLLSENNIIPYSEIMTDFRPIRQLALNQEFMDIDYVAGWLFDEGEEFTEVDEYGKTILRSDKKTLTYDNKQFVMDIPEGGDSIVLNRANAIAACEEKLSQLGNKALKYELDNEAYNGTESATLEYRIKYQGYYVYSSYVKFKVTGNSIVQIKCSLLSCDGFVDDQKDIYSADEALQALLYELKSIYGETWGERSIMISRMDIVYYLDFSKTSENPELKAIPYYRFYISERQEPFLINAYFNTPLRESP